MNRFDEQYQKKKQAALEAFQASLSESQDTFSLGKNVSNLFRERSQQGSKKLNLNGFNQVISIDPERLIAEVEGMITYEAFVAKTLEYGCLPPVVPQLKTITVGGALVGLGIESSSFRYGLVHETIFEAEVLTGLGTVLICTADNEHRDLFFALPNSYGTLGYVLKIKMKLIRTKPFVRLRHFRFEEIPAYFQALGELCLKHRAFERDTYIDGVIFHDQEMYISVAEFTDETPFLSNYTYMNVYYQSIQQKEIDYLTVRDYIWRWDADWFWCSKHFGMNSWILRLLFGKWMLRSASYWKIKRLFSRPMFKSLLQRFSKPSESVIQDILVPVGKAPQFYEFFKQSIGITPIWICPFYSLHANPQTPFFEVNPSVLYVDFGFWDIVLSDQPNGFLNRLIERKTEEVGGFKSLYSSAFYSEEEFWRIYPQTTSDRLKRVYDPQGRFKNLYEKSVQNR